MSSANNPVDAAIAQARQANAESASTAVSTQTSASAPSALAVIGKQKTLDDLGSAGLNVDSFLKVDKNGLEIKGQDGIIESITVVLNAAKDLQPFDCIKFGNPATYYKTYDGAKADVGGTWEGAVKKAQAADPTARHYEGINMTMTLIEDAANLKGTVVGQKGLVLGHSTSTTNFNNAKQLVDDITKAGLRNSNVMVKVGSEKRTNKSGNEWGVLTFELLGEQADA